MIDFSRLVLRPAMTAFSRAVTYKPAGGGEHHVRGVFDRTALDVPMEDGSIHTSVSPRLGIRLQEWPRLPAQQDRIMIGTETFMVVQADPDGQGGASIVLRKVSA